MSSHSRTGDIEQLSAASDVLVVMPDGGRVGFYSDWLKGPGWERFHTEELPQLLASRYRASDRRAVAGNSMGASAPSSTLPATQGYSPRPRPSAALCTRVCPATNPGSTLGSSTPRASTPTPYGAHPPWTIRSGLRTTRTISPKTSSPRRCSSPSATANPGRLTVGARWTGSRRALPAENLAFRARLTQLGAPATFDFYGPGSHDWPYWQRELHRAWALLTSALA
jgi:S-formylglutathione hydrolase FrmB